MEFKVAIIDTLVEHFWKFGISMSQFMPLQSDAMDIVHTPERSTIVPRMVGDGS